MLKLNRYDYASYLSFFCYAGCSYVIPVMMVEIANDLGFPLTSGGMGAGGIIHVVRSISMLIAMLLCGFCAGRFGKRLTLGGAVVLMGSGIIASAMMKSYTPLLVAILVAGCGEGLLEAIATPFVETLHKEESGRYVNLSHSFWSVGTFCSVLGIGALLSVNTNWRILMLAIGCLCIAPAVILLAPSKIKYPEEKIIRNKSVVMRQVREIFKTPRFWLFFAAMFFAGGAEFCTTFWAASFIRLALGGEAWAGGVGTAAIAAGMFVGRVLSGFFVRQKHLWHIVFAGAVIGLPLLFSLSLLQPGMLFQIYILLFFIGICVGPFWPSLQVYCTVRLPKLDSTQIFIYLSCAGIPGCGFFTWLIGALGDNFGLKHAFMIIPVTTLILIIILIVERLWKPKE